mmetsp:Transcript_26513/g.50220  ORF Transcript_26513/g.50220 Transcript_26513/m.50220 type:complete len:288 (-) Transcript_26513:66-929(-)
MKVQCTYCALSLALASTVESFTTILAPFGTRHRSAFARSSTAIDATAVFFGTSTGNTEEVADLLVAKLNELGHEAPEPICVDGVVGDLKTEFSKYEALIVGTPTWNTGADTERSGTAWDEVYYGELGDLDLSGKNVAVFGLGDQISYGENYADATGELHDVFSKLGCKIFGATEVDDSYEHEASKAIKDGKFCGLLCDQVNQDDLSEDRVDKWVKQLVSEGFMSGGGAAAAPAASAPEPAEAIEAPPASKPAVEVIHSRDGWVGHDNGESTLWVNSENRRESYLTKN